MSKLILILAAICAAIVPTALRAQVAWSTEDFDAVTEAVAAATPTNAVAETKANSSATLARIAEFRKRLDAAKGRGDAAEIRAANKELTNGFCAILDAEKAQAESSLARQIDLRDRMAKLLLVGQTVDSSANPAASDARRRAAKMHDGLFSADGLGALGVDSYSRGLAAQLAANANGANALTARLGNGADPLVAYNRAEMAIQSLERNIALYDTIKGIAIGRGIEVALATLNGDLGGDLSDSPVLGAILDTLGRPADGEAATGPIAPIGGEDDSLYY